MSAIENIVTPQDVEDARDLASDIVTNRPASRYTAFSNDSTIRTWCKDKSEELTKIFSTGLVDPRSLSPILTDFVELTLLEGCILSFIVVSKMMYSRDESIIPLQGKDLIMLELWERGLLPSEHYLFDPGKEDYLKKVKENFQQVHAISEKIKAMKEHGGV